MGRAPAHLVRIMGTTLREAGHRLLSRLSCCRHSRPDGRFPFPAFMLSMMGRPVRAGPLPRSPNGPEGKNEDGHGGDVFFSPCCYNIET